MVELLQTPALAATSCVSISATATSHVCLRDVSCSQCQPWVVVDRPHRGGGSGIAMCPSLGRVHPCLRGAWHCHLHANHACDAVRGPVSWVGRLFLSHSTHVDWWDFCSDPDVVGEAGVSDGCCSHRPHLVLTCFPSHVLLRLGR